MRANIKNNHFVRMRLFLIFVIPTIIGACAVSGGMSDESNIGEVGYLTRDNAIIILGSNNVKNALRKDDYEYHGHITIATINRNGYSVSTGRRWAVRRQSKIKLPNSFKQNQCFTLWGGGSHGTESVRLRENGVVPYYYAGFRNIFPLEKAKVELFNNKHVQAKSSLSSLKRSLERAERALAYDKNHKDGVCEIPLMADIPPKPVMPFNNSELQFAVTGFCMDVMARRYNKINVFTMLSSGMMTEFIGIHKAWKEKGGISNTPVCARHLRSRLSDGFYHLLGNIGESFLGSMGRSSALDSALGSCINNAISNCNAPIEQWKQRVAHIRVAPGQAYNSCKARVRRVPELKEEIKRQEKEVTVTLARYKKKKLEFQSLGDKIPLSEAQCR